ncbi:Uncharacterized protein PBTT_08715 [Plasmodiophora brassicae]
MERDADRAGAARDAALAAYVASRPAAPPAEDTTTLGRIGNNWGPLLIVLNGVIANMHPPSAPYLSGTVGIAALFLFLFRVCNRRR